MHKCGLLLGDQGVDKRSEEQGNYSSNPELICTSFFNDNY